MCGLWSVIVLDCEFCDSVGEDCVYYYDVVWENFCVIVSCWLIGVGLLIVEDVLWMFGLLEVWEGYGLKDG